MKQIYIYVNRQDFWMGSKRAHLIRLACLATCICRDYENPFVFQSDVLGVVGTYIK